MSQAVEIKVPSVFKGIIPLPECDVAIEHAPLNARIGQGIMAQFLFEMSNTFEKVDYLIVSRRTKVLEDQLGIWLQQTEADAKRTHYGYRLNDTGSSIYIMKPDEILGFDLPFVRVDKMLATDLETVEANVFSHLCSLTKKQRIGTGEFKNRDDWFYQWARSTGVQRFSIPARMILLSFPDELLRFERLFDSFSTDQQRRFLNLEDIEVRGVKTPPYLDWVKEYLLQYADYPMSKMHKDLDVTFTELANERGQKVLIVGPRDSAKSTHGSELYILYCICHQLERYILINSDTTEQACKHLAVIKEELVSNEKIAEKYPEAFGQGIAWKGNAIETRSGIRVEALGTRKKIRGRKFKNWRPTLIVTDDPEGDESAYSTSTREHTREWYLKGVMKAGGPTTNHVLIGSMIHQDGLVAHINRNPGWVKKIYKSIITWPSRMDLWAKWENIIRDVSRDEPEKDARKFYEENRAEMHRDADIMWEEREDLYALMLLRVTSGTASFESEKQNNPIDPTKCEWMPDLFEGKYFDELPEDDIIASASALDPSKGKKDHSGDYQGMATVSFHRKKILYVESDINRRPMAQMVERYVSFLTETRSQVGVVESDQFQELLKPEIEGSGVEENMMCPIEEITTGNVNKQMRIRRMGPWINRGRVLFRRGSPGTQLMVKQLQEFPNGDHDDGPDCLEMATRRVLQLVYGEDSDECDNPF